MSELLPLRVVIPTGDREIVLRRTLESLAQQGDRTRRLQRDLQKIKQPTIIFLTKPSPTTIPTPSSPTSTP